MIEGLRRVELRRFDDQRGWFVELAVLVALFYALSARALQQIGSGADVPPDHRARLLCAIATDVQAGPGTSAMPVFAIVLGVWVWYRRRD